MGEREHSIIVRSIIILSSSIVKTIDAILNCTDSLLNLALRYQSQINSNFRFSFNFFHYTENTVDILYKRHQCHLPVIS